MGGKLWKADKYVLIYGRQLKGGGLSLVQRYIETGKQRGDNYQRFRKSPRLGRHGNVECRKKQGNSFADNARRYNEKYIAKGAAKRTVRGRNWPKGAHGELGCGHGGMNTSSCNKNGKD